MSAETTPPPPEQRPPPPPDLPTLPSTDSSVTRQRANSEPLSSIGPDAIKAAETTGTAPSLTERVTVTPPTEPKLTNALRMTASPTPERDLFTASGSVIRSPHENVYQHSSFVYLGPIRYRFDLILPIAPNTSKEQIEAAIIVYRDMFLQNLVANLPPESPIIKQGSPFQFILNNDGYTIYTQTEGKQYGSFNPESESIEAAAARGCFDAHITVKDDKAKALCNIITTCSDNPSKMKSLLETDDLLKEYRVSTKKPAASTTPASGTTFRLVGFKNPGTSCFLNSGVQALAGDSVIREALLKPGVIKDVRGKPHPLKKVLEQYKTAQQLPIDQEPEPIDLAELRDYLAPKMSLNRQEDATEALSILAHDFNIEQNSPLYSIVQPSWAFEHPITKKTNWVLSSPEEGHIAQRIVVPEPGKSIETLLSEQVEGELDPVVVNREMRPDPEDPTKTVETLVEKTSIQSIIDPEDITKTKKIDVVPNQKKETFKAPPDVLVLHINRAKRDGGKNSTEIPGVSLTLELPGEIYEVDNGSHTKYYLESFCYHYGATGENGHYTTFIRDPNGTDFWEMNDAHEKRPVSKTEFCKYAQGAYFLIYHRKGLTPPPAATTIPQKNSVVGKKTRVEETDNTHVTVEMGTLTQAGPKFAIVNPTNSTLTQNTEAYRDIPELAAQVATARDDVAHKKFRIPGRDRNKVSFKAGTVVVTPKKDHVPSVLHVVLPSEFLTEEIIKKTVRAALEKAQEKQIESIALPLIGNGINTSETITNWMREAVKEYALKNKSHLHLVKNIKIIVPRLPETKPSTTPLSSTTTPIATPVQPALTPPITPPVVPIEPSDSTLLPKQETNTVKSIQRGDITYEIQIPKAPKSADSTPTTSTAGELKNYIKEQIQSGTTDYTFDLQQMTSLPSLEAATIIRDTVKANAGTGTKLTVRLMVPETDSLAITSVLEPVKATVIETIKADGVTYSLESSNVKRLFTSMPEPANRDTLEKIVGKMFERGKTELVFDLRPRAENDKATDDIATASGLPPLYTLNSARGIDLPTMIQLIHDKAIENPICKTVHLIIPEDCPEETRNAIIQALQPSPPTTITSSSLGRWWDPRSWGGH